MSARLPRRGACTFCWILRVGRRRRRGHLVSFSPRESRTVGGRMKALTTSSRELTRVSCKNTETWIGRATCIACSLTGMLASSPAEAKSRGNLGAGTRRRASLGCGESTRRSITT
ncbi:hypothetical protein K523DRAFT_63376 [Schizophyllum commune Tattone D]|nr:hypothetical protein K523DRAFT_63376 [Schizophyllum commune Tattone D]